MTTWLRVPLGATIRCGGCGAELHAGTPVARVTLPRVLARCEACAGVAPPALPDLPVVAAAAPVRTPMGLGELARRAFDWRARAAGMTAGREPGEDD